MVRALRNGHIYRHGANDMVKRYKQSEAGLGGCFIILLEKPRRNPAEGQYGTACVVLFECHVGKAVTDWNWGLSVYRWVC